jgi:hypothetical protein
VRWKPVGKSGLHSRLYAATSESGSSHAYMQEFLRIMRDVSFATLERFEPLPGAEDQPWPRKKFHAPSEGGLASL